MKILVLGGNGMAGHVIRYYLQSLSYDVYYSIREQKNDKKAVTLELTDQTFTYDCLQKLKPDIVINAAAILNDFATKNIKEAIYVNSFLPHLLASYGDEIGFKLIHISSDGVFSGKKGNYLEKDEKDATSVYAMTKNLGEVVDKKHVTIRTSIIGPDIRKEGIGLFHWFMNQSGDIQGFNEVYWNGVTSLELAKAIDWIIQKNTEGLVQLTARNRISKHDLLLLFKEVFNRKDIKIIPNFIYKKDNTLVNTRKDFSYQAPEYKFMIRNMREWMEAHSDLYFHYQYPQKNIDIGG
ncbi:MAG: SDR family oxidoreductase [Bacillota bacterium]|nr:SDR family oxidoreductase [Bacillota bacterium]